MSVIRAVNEGQGKQEENFHGHKERKGIRRICSKKYGNKQFLLFLA